MRIFSYDWTDYGYLMGITFFFGFYYHWSHFIITGVVLIFSIVGFYNNLNNAKRRKNV